MAVFGVACNCLGHVHQDCLYTWFGFFNKGSGIRTSAFFQLWRRVRWEFTADRPGWWSCQVFMLGLGYFHAYTGTQHLAYMYCILYIYSSDRILWFLSSSRAAVLDSIDVHPLKVLRSRAFYTLWFTFLLNGQGVVFISTLYKVS